MRVFTRSHSSRLLSKQLTYTTTSWAKRFRFCNGRIIFARTHSLSLRDLTPRIIFVATSPLLLAESELLLLLKFLSAFILVIEGVIEYRSTNLVTLRHCHRIVVLSYTPGIDYAIICCPIDIVNVYSSIDSDWTSEGVCRSRTFC